MRVKMIVALLAWLIPAVALAQGTSTQILLTRAAYDGSSQILAVEGQNFGTAPLVIFSTATSSFEILQNLEVSDTRVFAALKPPKAGTYVVYVVATTPAVSYASMDVTIGVTGPTGATGPVGPTGATGNGGTGRPNRPGRTDGPSGADWPGGSSRDDRRQRRTGCARWTRSARSDRPPGCCGARASDSPRQHDSWCLSFTGKHRESGREQAD